MISNESITPLLDLVFYPLLVLALVPFMRLFFLIFTGMRMPSLKTQSAPELVAWKREAEAVMARASIVPLRRKRRAAAMRSMAEAGRESGTLGAPVTQKSP
jgi:hypothetical protein